MENPTLDELQGRVQRLETDMAKVLQAATTLFETSLRISADNEALMKANQALHDNDKTLFQGIYACGDNDKMLAADINQLLAAAGLKSRSSRAGELN